MCVCMLLGVFVCMCVYFTVCALIVLSYKKLRVKFSRARPTQATVRQNAAPCISLHTQIVCKGLTLPMFPRAGSLLPPHRQICRPRRPALRARPAKSEVAEFAWKFKCLRPRATLNFDLHVDPQCRWMSGGTKEENNFRRGCGRISFVVVWFGFSVGCWQRWWRSPSRALLNGGQNLCSLAQKLLQILFLFNERLSSFFRHSKCLITMIFREHRLGLVSHFLPMQHLSHVVNTVTLWAFQNLS